MSIREYTTAEQIYEKVKRLEIMQDYYKERYDRALGVVQAIFDICHSKEKYDRVKLELIEKEIYDRYKTEFER